MSAVEWNTEVMAFLGKLDQRGWDALVSDLSESIHPVDRDATRIWFAFWPLKLTRALRETEDLEGLVRDWRLNGQYRLEEHLDGSVEFLWGAYYWPQVKQAVLDSAASLAGREPAQLEGLISETAARVAGEEGVDRSLLVGITAVAFMALRQIGAADFAASLRPPSTGRAKPIAPEKLLDQRSRQSGLGLFGFLRTVDRKFRIVFDENSRRECAFYAIHGQDVSMASRNDRRDYSRIDPRRLEGPVPFECRSGSCGFCWIGVLGGKDRLAEMSRYELQRLRYFGYVAEDCPEESHPPIRLACQSQCFGDLSIVVPPWNGVLEGRE